MANGANYQHSGLEPLRSNPQSIHAIIVSDKGPSKDVIPAAYQHSGTENLRSQEKDIHVPIISGGSGTDRFKPSPVDTFEDADV